MDLEKAIELLESVENQLTKKYGGMFDKNLSAHGNHMHKKAIENNVNELISAAKRNLPDDKKNSTDAIDREANKIEAKRNNTKNKVGAYKTDLHTIGLGGKLRSFSELDKNRKEDAKNGYKNAIEKSIKRHDKKISEALAIVEELISTATSLFEVEMAPTTEVEPSSNKLKREKKDKNGNRKEVVSVADELFPYDGDAKEQRNQKILSVINGMIEGTATLDDLMKVVKKPKKVSECYDEAISVVEELISEVSR